MCTRTAVGKHRWQLGLSVTADKRTRACKVVANFNICEDNVKCCDSTLMIVCLQQSQHALIATEHYPMLQHQQSYVACHFLCCMIFRPCSTCIFTEAFNQLTCAYKWCTYLHRQTHIAQLTHLHRPTCIAQQTHLHRQTCIAHQTHLYRQTDSAQHTVSLPWQPGQTDPPKVGCTPLVCHGTLPHICCCCRHV